MPYADALDETTPSDLAALGQGDDRIRELKRAINQRMTDLVNNWPDGALSIKIANGYVATAMLADDAVTAAKLATDSVTSDAIAPDAVGSAEIAASAVGTTELADNSVTNAKMTSVDGSKILDTSIPTAKLEDGAVETAKLADTAVATAKVADNAITNTKLADEAVTKLKIEAALRGKIAVTKYVDVAVPLTAMGSRTTVTLGATAFPGVAEKDFVGCALPVEYGAITDASQGKLMAVSAVASTDSITVVLRNNNDGAYNWPASTIRCWVTKSITAWGASL